MKMWCLCLLFNCLEVLTECGCRQPTSWPNLQLANYWSTSSCDLVLSLIVSTTMIVFKVSILCSFIKQHFRCKYSEDYSPLWPFPLYPPTFCSDFLKSFPVWSHSSALPPLQSAYLAQFNTQQDAVDDSKWCYRLWKMNDLYLLLLSKVILLGQTFCIIITVSMIDDW